MSRPRSFRSRLHRVLMPVLALSLLVFGGLSMAGLVWMVSYLDQSTMKAEAEEVESYILSGERLQSGRYHWQEPHHRFAQKRIDPLFVQIFDVQGRLIRASENVAQYTEYPPTLVRQTGFYAHNWNGQSLSLLVRPLISGKGIRMGYVQVGRFESDHEALIQYGVGGLTVFTLLILGIWWFLLRWLSGRVIRPLETITHEAAQISAHSLGERIVVPEQPDAETALLTESLNNLLDRLRNSFDEVKAFTANAAHELQTPITALMGAVDVALKRDRPPEEYRAVLEDLRVQVLEMRDMVRGLLDLARLDNPQARETMQKVDLSRIVWDAVWDVQVRAEQKGLQIKADIEPDVEMNGLQMALSRALQNVLDNAIKYTESGSITLTLRHQHALVLEVRDTGRGMSAMDVRQVGQRFYRAPDVRALDIPGSGLGLALVQTVVRLHQGTFSIHAVPNQGTTVVISFPKDGEQVSIAKAAR